MNSIIFDFPEKNFYFLRNFCDTLVERCDLLFYENSSDDFFEED